MPRARRGSARWRTGLGRVRHQDDRAPALPEGGQRVGGGGKDLRRVVEHAEDVAQDDRVGLREPAQAGDRRGPVSHGRGRAWTIVVQALSSFGMSRAGAMVIDRGRISPRTIGQYGSA